MNYIPTEIDGRLLANGHTDLPQPPTNYSEDTWIHNLKFPLNEKEMKVLDKGWPKLKVPPKKKRPYKKQTWSIKKLPRPSEVEEVFEDLSAARPSEPTEIA